MLCQKTERRAEKLRFGGKGGERAGKGESPGIGKTEMSYTGREKLEDFLGTEACPRPQAWHLCARGNAR